MLDSPDNPQYGNPQSFPSMLQSISASSRNHAQKENTPPSSNTVALQEQTDREKSSSARDDDLSSQNRILQLRKSNFRATTVAPRNHTPVNHAFFNPGEDSSPSLPALSSPLDQHSSSAEVNADECGVLQEISNSSLRRRRNNSTKPRASLTRTSLPRISATTSTPKRPKSFPEHALHINRSVSAGNVVAPPSPVLPNQEPSSANTPSQIPTVRHRARRSTQVRRSIHDEEASKYIEHLESQLAALQTQLQSISSPSTSRAQSSKLRAMNNESRLLRQEVQDWENKFADRLRDQTDQHEVIVGSLRAQVRSLERDAEVMQKRLHTLEADIEEKHSRIEAVDQSNHNLERRLEFMSELVATSPTKLELCSQDPMNARKRSPTRPKSLALPLAASSLPHLSPPQRAQRQSYIGSVSSLAIELDAARGTDLGSPITMRGGRRNSQIRRGSDTSNEESTVTEDVESTMSHERPLSPTHRTLNHLRSQTECETKSRPRQMRRFHGGAIGPRTLILPATSASSTLPASAPVSSILGPALSSPFLTSFDFDGNRPYPSNTGSRRRSATWDDDEGVASRSRRSTSFPNLTPIMKKDRTPFTPYLTSAEVHVRESDSAQAKPNQASVGYASGRSLFEEFEQLDDDDDDYAEDTASSSCSSFQQKCLGSPSPLRHIQPPSLTETDILKNSKKPATEPANETHAVDSTPVPQTRSLGLITALAKAISQSLDRRAPGVKTMCNNAWDIVTLSRPVLEFRWWLVKLLIGDLRKRRLLWPPITRSKEPGLPLLERLSSQDNDVEQSRNDADRLARAPHMPELNPTDSATALEDVLSHLDIVQVEEAERNKSPPPPPPPLYWLRFGLTLVFAVGIALKDGPASLLTPQRTA